MGFKNGEYECHEEWVVCKPVVDQSSPMETNIVPYDDILGMLFTSTSSRSACSGSHS